MIYIPVSEKELELDRVKKSIESLKKYRYDYEFITLSDYVVKGPKHQELVMEARNKLFETALKTGKKYICSQESSVIHLVDDNIKAMEKYLDNNPKCGAVFVNPLKRRFPGKAPYRKVALFMVRAELIKDFQFNLDFSTHGCECQQLPQHIKKQGYTADWLERKPGRIFKP